MKLFVYLVLFVVLFPLAVFSQEYGYTRYESKDGLGSSTVYCMTQDTEGFMWFGTDNGLSRFDGTHFRTFTQEHGLPDNEIIQLFADSKGRIWISPFKKTICYYYKGKIYTQENDSLLKNIHISRNVVRFAEDNQGNIILMEAHLMHLVTNNNEVYSVSQIHGVPIKYLSAVARNPAGGFWVIETNRLYEFNNRLFTLNKTIDLYSYNVGYASLNNKLIFLRNSVNSTIVQSAATRKKIMFPGDLDPIIICFVDDEHVAVNSPEGAAIHNIYSPDSLKHLPGVRVSWVLKDSEGNIWFTTLGQGVYRLNSASVLNSKYRDYNTSHQIFSFTAKGNVILVGSDMKIVRQLSLLTGKEESKSVLQFIGRTETIAAMYINREKNIIVGSASKLLMFSPQFKSVKILNNICIKGLYSYNDDLLVLSDRNIFRVNPIDLVIRDTLWHERATAAYAVNDTFYIGTVNGLYRRLPNGVTENLGDRFTPFRNRIAAIVRDTNNVLWVATFGGGLLAFKNETIVAHKKKENGLSSSICRTMFLRNNDLWVGTNQGINKIIITDTTYPIKRYTSADGLISDIINVIYVDKSSVFVGTPEGLSYFNEEKMASQSRCDLLLTDITVGGAQWSFDSIPALIDHNMNSVRFDYVAISYKSNGDVRYRYRLLGLDTAWKETRETFLSYPTLPSGDYQLQLQAINKFDVQSQLLTKSFTIDKLLYERTWFRLLMALLFMALTGFLVYVIVRRIRKREQEKTAISKRINELEQLSRKAQMNPHFIFNSLNSIQQYVMDADVTGANKFISGFSRLIRQTLDFSSKPEISLEEELDYLTNYLDIEKTRLEDAFSWKVYIDPAVDPAEYYIPPMILQPFVENSVRHGLRFRRDKNGVVTISVKREGNYLICVLEDNGVGRKAAMQYKSISPINYQSKGLSLTADRIAMFNKEHSEKIDMTIEDLEDNFHNSLGTRVTISFPVF